MAQVFRGFGPLSNLQRRLALWVVLACLAVPSFAQAQIFSCTVANYGVFGAGYPTAFQVTYEPGGTAVVQHDWQGEPYAVRVEVDDRGRDGMRMTYRIRFVAAGGERVNFSFILRHYRNTNVFTSVIQPLRYREVTSQGRCQAL